MDTASTVAAARRVFGPVGAYLPASFTDALDIGRQREAARRLEQAGFGAGWANEGIGGKDVLAQLGILMASTDRLRFGTGIANIWARAHLRLCTAARRCWPRLIRSDWWWGSGRISAPGCCGGPGVRSAAHRDAQLPRAAGCARDDTADLQLQMLDREDMRVDDLGRLAVRSSEPVWTWLRASASSCIRRMTESPSEPMSP